MPLNKVKSGSNMYDWVTHTHNHLAGECPHGCIYCSIKTLAKRFPNMRSRYSGPVRLIESELAVKYGGGKRIFIENCNDLFADNIPEDFIVRILKHCSDYPGNTYVFQTKNPERIIEFLLQLPESSWLGTTIESNRWYAEIMRLAPHPSRRSEAMILLPNTIQRFVTVEPILNFDLPELTQMICGFKPDFVNIGADSKKHKLPEPCPEKIRALIHELVQCGIEVNQKSNLKRLL